MKNLQILALSLIALASFSQLQAMDDTDIKITETKTNWSKTLKKILIEPGIKLGVFAAIWLTGRIKANKTNAALNNWRDNWARSTQWSAHYNQNTHSFDKNWLDNMNEAEKAEFNRAAEPHTEEIMSKYIVPIGGWTILSIVGIVGSIVYTYKFLRKLYSEQEVDVIEKNLDKELEAELQA